MKRITAFADIIDPKKSVSVDAWITSPACTFIHGPIVDSERHRPNKAVTVPEAVSRKKGATVCLERFGTRHFCVKKCPAHINSCTTITTPIVRIVNGSALDIRCQLTANELTSAQAQRPPRSIPSLLQLHSKDRVLRSRQAVQPIPQPLQLGAEIGAFELLSTLKSRRVLLRIRFAFGQSPRKSQYDFANANRRLPAVLKRKPMNRT